MSQVKRDEILERLISFQSISVHSNFDIVEYIENYLASFGVASRRIVDASGEKASLLASIGPRDRAGVVLSAHTDVVPVEGQAWSSPPFAATFGGGRVVGRGATDMKGFIACVLAQVPRFIDAAREAPVHIALSYDEEVGCRGAPDLVDAVARLPVRPNLCVVGEPTGLRVVRAHKGKVARRVEVRGRGGHSALPHRAVNAVVAASRIVSTLASRAEKLMQDGGRDEAFDPSWTTLHVGSIHGGAALNLVPNRAVLEFEVRAVPGTDVAAILAEIDAELAALKTTLRRDAPEADIIVEEIAAYPALATPARDAAVTTVARLAGDNNPPTTVSFGTEAGLYAVAGIPTVVCGPGDIARAHKADEWIGLDELDGCDRMLERLAAQLSRPADEWIIS